jgi:hypothetical protein
MTHDSTGDLSKRGRYWLEHIRQWQQSHSTQCEYCRQRDLSITAFRWWRRELVRKGIDVSQARDSDRTQGESGSFLELALTRQTASRGSTVYEIVLSNQRRLALAEGFDPDAVATLVSILEARC